MSKLSVQALLLQVDQVVISSVLPTSASATTTTTTTAFSSSRLTAAAATATAVLNVWAAAPGRVSDDA